LPTDYSLHYTKSLTHRDTLPPAAATDDDVMQPNQTWANPNRDSVQIAIESHNAI